MPWKFIVSSENYIKMKNKRNRSLTDFAMSVIEKTKAKSIKGGVSASDIVVTEVLTG